MLEIELIQETERFSALKGEWDALFEEASERSLFLSHCWYDCWWRRFSTGAALSLIVLREGGRMVGVAPLQRRRLFLHGIPVRALLLISNGNSLHNDFVVVRQERDRAMGVLLRYLYDTMPGWDVLQLTHVPADSANLAGLTAELRGRGKSFHQRPSYDSPYLDLDRGWESFLAGRSQRVRKTLRNIQNSLARYGEPEVTEVTGWQEFLSVWDEVRRVAQGSWTTKVGDSLATPANASFFQDLARAGEKEGWLSLWLLRLDGRAIAFEFHLRGNGTEHALRASYDQEFARLSPGAYLEMQILKRLFDEPRGITRFDFGGSFDAYKRRWSDRSREHVSLLAFNDGFYPKLAAFHEKALVTTARKVRDRLRRRDERS